MQKEAQLYKRQIIGVDEIKRDRDTRINLLRNEIEELRNKLEKLEKAHASLSVKYEAAALDNAKMTAE